MRKKIVAGNWKMNTGLQTSKELVTEIKGMVTDEVNGDVEIMVFPPFLFATSVMALLKDTGIITGVQNIAAFDNGAFTGEISAQMVNSAGITYTLLGHSERRQYFGDDDNMLMQKIRQAIDYNLHVIFCCGETLQERENENHFAIVKHQIKHVLFSLTPKEMERITIAYEPVWAIGTGVTASAAQAQEMHAYIRNVLRENFSDDLANSTRILYGGSVKPENAAELFACADIDGGLIGGAALSSRSFVEIIKAAAV